MDVDVLVARAGEAFKIGNYKTALDLLSHSVASSPDNGQLFELFHSMASKRPINGLSRALGTIVPSIAAQIALSAGKTVGARKSALKAIWANPKSPGPLRLFARAAGAGGSTEVAMLALEKANSVSPGKTAILRELGYACWKAKHYQAAKKCFYEIQQKRPTDKEAQKALKDLDAEATISEGRYDEKGDFRKSAKDLDRQTRLHDESRFVRTEDDADRAIADTEADIKENPDKVLSYLKLAKLHRYKKDWELAFAALGRGLAVFPDNGQLTTRKSEYEIARQREMLEETRKRLKENPDDAELRQEVTELEREELDFEIEELEKQVAAHPTETDPRIKLGMLYARAGRGNDAISAFQKCVNDPRRRLKALLLLGREFAKKKTGVNMAIRQFQAVVDEVEIMNDTKKEATYQLATALDKAGRLKDALKHFQEVYEVDIAYEDVANKVESLYDRIHEQGSETENE